MRNELSVQYKLTPTDLAEKSAGGVPRFYNRTAWAVTYLKRAGLIEATKRGVYKITAAGKSALGGKPARIDIKFLSKYPEFSRSKVDHGLDAPIAAPNQSMIDGSPDEAIDAIFRTIRQKLVSELIDQIQKCSPTFFEQLVVELLVKMGYGGDIQDAGSRIGKSGDGGIDGTIKEDRLGLDVIYIQAKRWKETIGRPLIQSFVGALHGKGSKGVFITTSSFSKDAEEYAKTLSNIKLVLIDGERLAELMIDLNIGVSPKSPKQIYEIKKVDYDYFSEEE